MRNFNKLERSIIKKWVDARLNNEIYKLSVGAIFLAEHKELIALEWDTSSARIMYDKGIKTEALLGHLFDVLSLVKYLDDNGFIFLSKNNHPQTEANKIYNKDMYDINADGEYWSRCRDAGITIRTMEVTYESESVSGFSNYDITTLYCDFSILLNKYAHGLVYPSQILVEYVQNDFKTEEQLKFEQQMSDTQIKHAEAMRTARYSLRLAIGAFVVALIPTCCSVVDRCSEKDMTIRELNSTIKTLPIPNTIKAELQNDTIKVIIVDHRKSKSAK